MTGEFEGMARKQAEESLHTNMLSFGDWIRTAEARQMIRDDDDFIANVNEAYGIAATRPYHERNAIIGQSYEAECYSVYEVYCDEFKESDDE